MTDNFTELKELNQYIFDAEAKKKIGDDNWDTFLWKVLADEFIIRRSNPVIPKQNRGEIIKWIEQHPAADRNILTDEVEVWCDGALGVVTSPVTMLGSDGNLRRYQNIKVFEKKDGHWKCIYWQVTLVSAPQGLEIYERVLGEPNTAPLTGIREFTINHLFANVWSRRQLSVRDRRLITIALLATQGHTEQLEKHIRGALYGHFGLSKDEVLEVMIQVAHYAGWAAGTSGHNVAREVFECSDTPKVQGGTIELKPGSFDLSQAIADIANEGWWPYTLKAEPGDNYAPHYHETDETLYLIEGSLVFKDIAAQKEFELVPGNKLFIPSRTIHTVRTHKGATYLMGLREIIPLEDFMRWA